MIKFIMSSSAEALAAVRPHVTIEAEYGEAVVGGGVLTLAHHGPRAGNPPPCVVELGGGMLTDIWAAAGRPGGILVGLSHVDLDTLGGVLALSRQPLGARSVFERAFWTVAGRVDVEGAHRLDEILSSQESFCPYCNGSGEGEAGVSGCPTCGGSNRLDVDHGTKARIDQALHAWWAWAQANRCPQAPRDGSVIEVTEYVERALDVLGDLLAPLDTEGRLSREAAALVDEGIAFKAAGEKLNAASLLRVVGAWSLVDLSQSKIPPAPQVAVRASDHFVNHLYQQPHGWPAPADIVIALNTKSGAITVSKSSPSLDFNCCAFVQQLWGAAAGGHAGIAGSPRDRAMSRADLDAAVQALTGEYRCCSCGAVWDDPHGLDGRGCQAQGCQY